MTRHRRLTRRPRDADQTSSDADQTAAGLRTGGSDEDQAASDRESLAGADQQARDIGSEHREHATQIRGSRLVLACGPAWRGISPQTSAPRLANDARPDSRRADGGREGARGSDRVAWIGAARTAHSQGRERSPARGGRSAREPPTIAQEPPRNAPSPPTIAPWRRVTPRSGGA